MFEAEGAPGLITIGSAHNIDLNPMNRDAKDALHGTGCALTQLPISTSTGTVRSAELYRDAALSLSTIAQLPRFYTSIKEIFKSLLKVCHFQLLLDLAGHQHTFSGHHNLSTESMLQTSTNLLPSGSATQSSSVEEHWVTHAVNF